MVSVGERDAGFAEAFLNKGEEAKAHLRSIAKAGFGEERQFCILAKGAGFAEDLPGFEQAGQDDDSLFA